MIQYQNCLVSNGDQQKQQLFLTRRIYQLLLLNFMQRTYLKALYHPRYCPRKRYAILARVYVTVSNFELITFFFFEDKSPSSSTILPYDEPNNANREKVRYSKYTFGQF